MGMMRCRDGWVQLVGVMPAQWDALAASPDADGLADERIATAAARAENMALAAAALQEWCEQRDKADIVRILAPLGCPVGAYAEPADLLASEQLAHRGFFREVDDGRGEHDARARAALPPLRDTGRDRIGPRARKRQRVRRSTRAEQPRLSQGRGARGGARPRLHVGRRRARTPRCLLALLGAEVIKVESTTRPDPARRGFLADYGGINRSPNFNELNLNKRSFQVDLSQPEGLALAHRLAGEWADVVVDNFRPGVMARFGLDADDLLARRPELVVVSSSANGSTGPEAMAAGLASIFGATGGL